MEDKSYATGDNTIHNLECKDEKGNGVNIRKCTGTIQRTGGESDFQVLITGLQEKVDEFTRGLAFPKIELTRIAGEAGAKSGLETRVLEARRKNWYSRLDEIKDYIGHADLDQLSDPLLLCHLTQGTSKSLPLLKAILDLKVDFRVELNPIIPFNPEFKYHFSMRVEHIHSPISIDRGQIHSYAYRFGEPEANSAEIHVTDGDADLFLYRGGTRMDYSTNGLKQNDFVYAEGGSGAWEVWVRGFTAAFYEIDADWL